MWPWASTLAIRGFISLSKRAQATPSSPSRCCPQSAVHLPSRRCDFIAICVLYRIFARIDSGIGTLLSLPLPLLIYAAARCPIEWERRRVLQLLILRLHEAPDAPPCSLLLAPAAVVQGQLLTIDIKITTRVGPQRRNNLGGRGAGASYLTSLGGMPPSVSVLAAMSTVRSNSSSIGTSTASRTSRSGTTEALAMSPVFSPRATVRHVPRLPTCSSTATAAASGCWT